MRHGSEAGGGYDVRRRQELQQEALSGGEVSEAQARLDERRDKASPGAELGRAQQHEEVLAVI